MKKFIVIAMVATFAVISQAASFNWVVNGTGLGTAGYCYAMTGTAADRTAVELLLAAGDIAGFQAYYAGLDSVFDIVPPVATYGANSHVALGDGQTLTTPPGGLTAVSLGGFKNVFVDSTAQGVFFVLFDNANPLNADNYNLSARIGGTLPGAGGAATEFNPTWGNWGGAGVSGSTTWMPIIPEPTAMALLALGAAAVGLRRRFRK